MKIRKVVLLSYKRWKILHNLQKFYKSLHYTFKYRKLLALNHEHENLKSDLRPFYNNILLYQQFERGNVGMLELIFNFFKLKLVHKVKFRIQKFRIKRKDTPYFTSYHLPQKIKSRSNRARMVGNY